jgi:hypothetical protein
MEGNGCFQAAACDMAGLTLPELVYPHGGGSGRGCSVTGGTARHPRFRRAFARSPASPHRTQPRRSQPHYRYIRTTAALPGCNLR